MRVLLSLVSMAGLLLLGMHPVAAEVTIRYGVQRTMSPVYIALALGLFAPIERKDHIRFLFPQFENGSAANAAMADEDQDLQLLSEDAGSCIAAASRLPVTLVALDASNNGECVSDAFLTKRPDVVQDIVKALVRASVFIIKHPNDAAELWSRQTGMSKDVIRATLTEHMRAYARDITPSKARVDAYVKHLRQTKTLKGTDVPKIDASFARKATTLVAPAASAPTKVVRYTPFHSEHVRGDLIVAGRLEGSCWTASIAVPRPDAWRCMAGNEIRDPCFSASSRAREVVCVGDPFSHRVTLMRLTRRLEPKAHGREGEPHAWKLRLTNGVLCGYATGATGLVARMRLNYACSSKGWIAGNPDRSVTTWKANYVASPDKPVIRKVAIAIAVF
jgi:hypothetical protein